MTITIKELQAIADAHEIILGITDGEVTGASIEITNSMIWCNVNDSAEARLQQVGEWIQEMIAKGWTNGKGWNVQTAIENLLKRIQDQLDLINKYEITGQGLMMELHTIERITKAIHKMNIYAMSVPGKSIKT
jgi:hypothetical protein